MLDFLQDPRTDQIIHAALKEDVGPGDFTSLSTIPAGLTARAKCLIKDEGILAGMEIARRIFEIVDPALKMEALAEEGDSVKYGDIVFYVEGDPRSILTAERLVLNIMQRMSGIATYTHKVSAELEGLACKVLDTRKTTPLIRHLEKWAVYIGGGVNHRFGLYDMVMIKDNHVDYAGGIPEAISACKDYLAKNQLDLNIEVETRNIAEVKIALAEGGIHRIMLDNMSLDEMREAVSIIDGQTQTEASGGITLERVRVVGETGVDYVSMGALTHSVKSMDISLKAVS